MSSTLVKKIAKYSSQVLSVVALILVVTNKLPIGDKEVPASLRK